MFFPFRDNVPTRHTPVVTFGLIAVNVAVFLWMVGLPEDKQEELVFRRGFVPARIGQLFHGRAIDVKSPKGQVITPDGRLQLVFEEIRLPPAPRQTAVSLVTYMFLHGGWLHMLGNMWFLWIFGNNVEDRLGPVLYLLLYLGGGLVALACQWAVAPGSAVPMIGASGAVATILGAYAVTWPHARVQTLVFLLFFVTVIELPAMLFLGLWFLWQVLSAALSLGVREIGAQGGVAFWAHVGGFVAGLLLMPTLNDLLRCPQPQRPTSDF
jgi:membrane associated rhomboid family serine protease